VPERECAAPAPPFADPVAARVGEALIDAIVESGYEAVSIADVIARSGVTPAEFEARYADKEHCVVVVCDAYVGDFLDSVDSAYRAAGSWRAGLRAASYAAADWMEAHQRATRAVMVDLLQAESETVRLRREEIVRFAVGLLDIGRAHISDPGSVPRSAPVLAVGAVLEMVTRRLQSGRDLRAREMVPELLFLALRPYVGEEAAREELRIPPPAP
jgi:AcrR family transcriptional regulator